MKIENVGDVNSWRLCVGCGICKYICPAKRIELIDIVEEGIRPVFNGKSCLRCGDCVKVCPGLGINQFEGASRKTNMELRKGFGPVVEAWEGYAGDRNIRVQGSSGGAVSALALYCVESGLSKGVIHIGADEGEPWRNRAVVSEDRRSIVLNTGSRYLPASPCEGLNDIESMEGAFLFVGKPCDVAGIRKAQALKMELQKKINVLISIFCAGTPSTEGTLNLLERMKINKENVSGIRYRGKGWPGSTEITLKNNSNSYALPYQEAWGFLNNYRPFRCYLCPDGAGEFADISCGDPWYRRIEKTELGQSLLLVRTEAGQRLVRDAMKSGFLVLQPLDPQKVIASQVNLLEKRGSIWGRLITMRALGILAPTYQGFPLLNYWLNLPMLEKIRSILGTTRRIIQRKYYRPKSI